MASEDAARINPAALAAADQMATAAARFVDESVASLRDDVRARGSDDTLGILRIIYLHRDTKRETAIAALAIALRRLAQ